MSGYETVSSNKKDHCDAQRKFCFPWRLRKSFKRC